jgi:hypothetical protein
VHLTRATEHLRDALLLSGIWECVSIVAATDAAAAFVPPLLDTTAGRGQAGAAEQAATLAALKDDRMHAARVAAFADWVTSWDGTAYQQWAAEAIAAAAAEGDGPAPIALPEAPPIPATVAELVPLAAAVREFTLRAAVLEANDGSAAGAAGIMAAAGDCPPAFLEPHEAATVAGSATHALTRAAELYRGTCVAHQQAAGSGGKHQQPTRGGSASVGVASGLLDEDDDVALVPRVFIL